MRKGRNKESEEYIYQNEKMEGFWRLIFSDMYFVFKCAFEFIFIILIIINKESWSRNKWSIVSVSLLSVRLNTVMRQPRFTIKISSGIIISIRVVAKNQRIHLYLLMSHCISSTSRLLLRCMRFFIVNWKRIWGDCQLILMRLLRRLCSNHQNSNNSSGIRIRLYRNFSIFCKCQGQCLCRNTLVFHQTSVRLCQYQTTRQYTLYISSFASTLESGSTWTSSSITHQE